MHGCFAAWMKCICVRLHVQHMNIPEEIICLCSYDSRERAHLSKYYPGEKVFQ
jgi:hypothetical protein